MGNPDRTLVGRDSEVRDLSDALAASVSGRMKVTLIEGEAGIGKSRLLEEIRTIAEKQGVAVREGRSEELDQSRPFGAVADAFGINRKAADAARADLARLITLQPELESSFDAGMQTRAVEALVDFAEMLSVETPFLLTLDDLQWADPSTLITLLALARALPYSPIALLLAFRPVPRIHELRTLIEGLSQEGALELTLQPLADDAVKAIVSQEVGATPGNSLLSETARAAGNPLFITELLRAIRQDGALVVEDGFAELTHPVHAPALHLLILRRIAFLGERTLQMLRLASILGSSFSLTELALISEKSLPTILADLDSAVRSGIVTDGGDSRLRFRHDLLREALYEDIPESARNALHADIAKRLVGANGPPLTIAHHFSIGAEPGDSAAVLWLHRAGRQLAAHAPQSAVEMMEHAMKLVGRGDSTRDELEIDLLLLRLWTGQVAETEHAARELLARPLENSLLYEARRVLVETYFHRNRWREAAAEAASAVVEFQGRQRAKFLCYLATSAAFAGEEARAEAAAHEAREISERLGDLELLSFAYVNEAIVSHFQGDFHQELEFAERAVAFAEKWVAREPDRLEAQLDLACAIAQRAQSLVTLDRLTQGRREHNDALRRFDRLGSRAYLASFAIEQPLYAFLAGDWDETDTGLETAAALFAEQDVEPTQTFLALRAVLALHRGDLLSAEREAALDLSSRTMARGRLIKGVVVGATDKARGADIAEKALEELSQSREPIFLPPLLIDGARLGIEAGRVSLCNAIADWFEELASRVAMPATEAYALHARGLAESDSAILVKAVQAFRNSSREFGRAIACEDAAAALARESPTAEAASLLEEALETYQRAGAERDIAHATGTLRALGVVRLRRQTRRRPSIGWESLTATEREVVRLAAQGLTNPQIGEQLFVSRRTVQSHLRHVFAKLGISSRVELAAAAAADRDKNSF